MNQPATILPLYAPVIHIITNEERKLVTLLAQIIVDNTLKKVYEKGDTIPTEEHRAAK